VLTPSLAEKKKPWVATKDSYRSKDVKNMRKRKDKATERKPAAAKTEKKKAKEVAKEKASEPSEPKDTAESSAPPPPAPSSVATAPSSPSPAPASTGKAVATSELRAEDEVHQYSFRLHSYLGVMIAQNSALTYGINAAITPGGDSVWYFGPEVSYSNPNAGSITSVLIGAWRDIPVYGASRLSLGIGALAGPVFAAPGSGYNSVTYAGFFNTALCKEIDELAVIRAEFRPGWISGRFAFLMNFGVSFRFL